MIALACVTPVACGVSRKLPASDGPATTLVLGIPQAGGSDPSFGFERVAPLFVQEGLTTVDRTGRAVARLAESWTRAPDGLSWTFRLRREVYFHDGTPLTADLVVRSLRASLLSASSRRMPGLLDVAGVEVTGPLQITIYLRKPSTFLLDDVNEPIMLDTPRGQVGTGPFKLALRGPTEIDLESHRRYHQGRPAIDRIVLKPYPTLRAAWASMMRGDTDLLYEVGQEAVDFLAAESTVRVFSFVRGYVYLVAFNSRRPMFRNPLVRRALNLAVDRTAVVRDGLRGKGLAVSGPFWPEHWAFDKTAQGFPFDPAAAASLLNSAGVSHRRPLTFTCLLPENYSAWERIGLVVQRQLYEVGVEMRLQVLPADKMVQRVTTGDFEAVLFEVASGPRLSRAYMFWHSPGELRGWNVFGYSSPMADEGLDRIRLAPDDAALARAVSQFQHATLEDPPAIFLCLPLVTRALSLRFRVPDAGDPDVLVRLRDSWHTPPVASRH